MSAGDIRLVGFDEAVIPNQVYASENDEASKLYVLLSRYQVPTLQAVIAYIQSEATATLEGREELQLPGQVNRKRIKSPIEQTLDKLDKRTQEKLAKGNEKHYEAIKRQSLSFYEMGEEICSRFEELHNQLEDKSDRH